MAAATEAQDSLASGSQTRGVDGGLWEGCVPEGVGELPTPFLQ